MVRNCDKALFERISDVMADDPEVLDLCDRYIARLSKPNMSEDTIELACGVASYMADNEGVYTNRELTDWYNEGLDDTKKLSVQKMGAALRYLIGLGSVTKVVGDKASDPIRYKIA